MASLRGAVTSARLTFKIHRFEMLAVTILGLGLAAAALVVTYRLASVGVTPECLQKWLSGGGAEGAGDCAAVVSRWASINEGEAGKVAAAMALVPWVIGILVGVPLVGRELEARTAATAWSMAGSRARWLFGRFVPAVLLVLVLSVVAAAAAAVLEVARSGGGGWQEAYFDAELFGPPVVGHALAGFGIGLLAGAVVGRTLPALIVGAVVAIVIFNVSSMEHYAFLPPSVQAAQGVIEVSPTEFTSGTPDVARLVLDPDLDYAFQGADGKIIDRETALGSMPAGTSDVATWLTTHYQAIFEGPSDALTARWQLVETAALGILAGVLILLTFPAVECARPT